MGWIRRSVRKEGGGTCAELEGQGGCWAVKGGSKVKGDEASTTPQRRLGELAQESQC